METPSHPAAHVRPEQAEVPSELEPFVTLLRTLHADFIESHANVHTVYVASHEREHTNDANALRLAAENLHAQIIAVRQHYDAVLEERDRRYAERMDNASSAVATALSAAERAVANAFDAREKALVAAFESADKAITKSEIGQEKRADATFVSLVKLQEMLAGLMPRAECEARFGNQEQRIAANTARIERDEGRSGGVSHLGSTLLAGCAVFVAIVAVIATLYVGLHPK